MKSVFLASAALALTLGSAQAQDAGYNWSGFYVGAQAGYGWSRTEFGGTVFVDEDSDRQEGFVGGIYAGRDWQSDRWVFGALADLDYIAVDEQSFTGKDESYTYDIDWMATARVRAGFLPTERLLVYGTGGLAFANIKTGGTFEGDASRSYDDSEIEIGGVIGAGVEFAITNNFSIKTEYLHYDFNSTRPVDIGVPGDTTFDPSVDTVKVGLTFRFGS